MGLTEDIAAIRADIPTHAVNLFVDFFVVYPQYLELFPNWKGKSLETLKGEAHFISILTKVTVKLMGIIEVSGDADKLTAACKDLAAMPQHKIRKMQEFKDLGPVLVAYLEKTLGGSCDSAAWNAAYNKFISTLTLG